MWEGGNLCPCNSTVMFIRGTVLIIERVNESCCASSLIMVQSAGNVPNLTPRNDCLLMNKSDTTFALTSVCVSASNY